MTIKTFIKQYGWVAIPRLLKSLLRRIGVIIETFFLLKYSINKIDINNRFNEFDYSEVRELLEEDLWKLEFLGAEKIKIYRQRFRDGNYSCYAIVKENEVKYITWISWEYMSYPLFFNKREKLNKNQALLEDSFCSPDFRGKGYHSKMNIFRLKKILDKEKSEVLALLLKENLPAIRVQLKSGFYYDSKIKYVRIFRWSRTSQKILNDRN